MHKTRDKFAKLLKSNNAIGYSCLISTLLKIIHYVRFISLDFIHCCIIAEHNENFT